MNVSVVGSSTIVSKLPAELLDNEVHRRYPCSSEAKKVLAAALDLMDRAYEGAAYGGAGRLLRDPLDVVADMADILRAAWDRIQSLSAWKSIDEETA